MSDPIEEADEQFNSKYDIQEHLGNDNEDSMPNFAFDCLKNSNLLENDTEPQKIPEKIIDNPDVQHGLFYCSLCEFNFISFGERLQHY